jgi:hypothetical protein
LFEFPPPAGPPRGPFRALIAVAALALILFTGANCAGPPPAAVVIEPTLPMRGDVTFDRESLDGAISDLYQQLLDDLDRHDGVPETLELAARDDLYTYGRTLSQHVQSILAVFRLTGDLVLLDHVDVIAERMRAELRDGWRDTNDGSDGERDGYLNWVWRHSDTSAHTGKDTHEMDEIKAHALVALIAYALDQNRDLPSPTGRDYAAHADFWRDYLVHHFEAKWRERKGVAVGFPIMVRSLMHPYVAWVKWHFYMWKLTGEAGYLAESTRLASLFWERELRPVDTPAGEAYVWPHGVLSAGSEWDYLQPTIYARYLYGHFVELHFENFHRWSDDDEMARLARTVTELITDDPDPVAEGFASNVGGGESFGGLVSRADDERLTGTRFSIGTYALIAPWDESGRLARTIEDLQGDLGASGTTQLTAGRLLDAWQRGDFGRPAPLGGIDEVAGGP